MALVRILVDGYSLLHDWPELAPGKPRHSAAARDELIRVLTLYRDAVGTPMTIVFDGAGAPAGTPRPVSIPQVEVLYSRAGQTADDIIERVAFRMKDYGEVLAVTNDYAERDTVLSLDGLATSCQNFIRDVENTLREQEREIKIHNRRERTKFKDLKTTK
jgi:predicted RNA-binding protein with PIN domain